MSLGDDLERSPFTCCMPFYVLRCTSDHLYLLSFLPFLVPLRTHASTDPSAMTLRPALDGSLQQSASRVTAPGASTSDIFIAALRERALMITQSSQHKCEESTDLAKKKLPCLSVDG
jgi:hypothetical protein